VGEVYPSAEKGGQPKLRKKQGPPRERKLQAEERITSFERQEGMKKVRSVGKLVCKKKRKKSRAEKGNGNGGNPLLPEKLSR